MLLQLSPDQIKDEIARLRVTKSKEELDKIPLIDINCPEFCRYEEDYRKHPLLNRSSEYGSYKGVQWEIKRPSGTHLCGYLLLDKSLLNELNLSNDEMDEIESCSHYGFTASWGFDCAHFGDYIPNIFDCGIVSTSLGITYKDFEYVKDVINRIVDKICQLRPRDMAELTIKYNI
jgi:hypothetical protein